MTPVPRLGGHFGRLLRRVICAGCWRNILSWWGRFLVGRCRIEAGVDATEKRQTLDSENLPNEYVEHLSRRGFVLEKVLGRGGSGSVYLAEQTNLNRKVAIKFFDSAFARDDPAAKKRFSREAKLLARFQHPGFPHVLTQGSATAFFGEAPYFVMEYVAGSSLKDLLSQQIKLPLEVSIGYACQILSALGYAHSRKILHRDVKPANIMVDANSRCFVIDFSIGVSTALEAGLTRATTTGESIGTPQYMAPEQLNDASKTDNRADIFRWASYCWKCSPEIQIAPTFRRAWQQHLAAFWTRL